MEQAHNKKHIILCLLIMIALTQAGLVLYTPAFVEIAHSLGVGAMAIKNTLSSYLIGFGISQLIYGPLSDRVGRKKMLLLGVAIFSLGCLWSVFVQNYSEFLISRFVQGLGIGACMTLSRSILRDCFTGVEYFRAASYLASGFALGLGLTPVIGGHLLDFFTWRAEFVFLFISGVGIFLIFWWLLPETHKLAKPQESHRHFWLSVLKNSVIIVKNLNFICYLVGGVLAYSVVLAYSTITPFLFQNSLQVSPSLYGWLTLILAAFYYSGASFNRILVGKLGVNAMLKLGLTLILLSGLAMLLSHLCFRVFNLYVIFIPLLVATFGQSLVWSNSVACALKDLPHIAGTGAAVFGSLQMFLSALVSSLIAMISAHNQAPLAWVLLGLGLGSWLVFQISAFRSPT